MKKINITHAAVTIAVAAALAASAALAGDKTKKATAPATQVAMPAFEHVIVERASPEMLARIAAEQKQQQSAAGMRAYVDGNGRLRAPNSDDLKAEAAAAPQAKSAARFAARSFSAAAAEPAETYHANGAVSVQLDDSYMSYSVATVQPNGKVKEKCVTGEPSQDAALAAAAATPGVDSHDK
jgi:hypothetical protein